MREQREPIRTWAKMEVGKKYRLSLKHKSMSVKDMSRFDDLIVQCDIRSQEDNRLVLSRFHIGLRAVLQCKMLLHTVDSISETYQLAINFETYLQKPSDRKSTFKIGK